MSLKKIFLLCVAVAGSVVACGPPYEEDMDLIFGDLVPEFHSYSTEGQTIYYVEIGSPSSPPVLFLHGTPGSWSAFGDYLSDPQLADSMHMVAVDRPGFGRSDHTNLLPSLAAQSEVFGPLLERLARDCGAVLVGHSLGAPLAVRMAMDFPKKVAALVLVAPSLDPDLEQPRWYNKVADTTLVNWLLPTELALANQEVMVLPGELQEMLPLYPTLDLPITLIQGEKDKLVHPDNADFAEKMVPDRLRVVRLEEAGHFVLWEQPELIKDELQRVFETHIPKGYCQDSG